MNKAYFETRFRCEHPPDAWPSGFVIISAFATTGESWHPGDEAEFDGVLLDELARRGVNPVRVVGYSPSTGHAEPSWAVTLPLEVAREVGRKFRQDAIYHVNHGTLYVSYCDEQSPLVPVGRFHERLDLPLKEA